LTLDRAKLIVARSNREQLRYGKEAIMASEQSNHLAAVLGAAQDRLRNPDLGLPTVRDIAEAAAALGKEPEGVTYAEVDAGGVPALWCIPQGSDVDSVLLHCHAGGTVVFSMNSDRKAAGHLAKAAGIRALVLDFRRSPENKFPAQQDDVETAYHWLLAQGYRPEKIASGGHSVGGNLAVSLAIRLRDQSIAPPARNPVDLRLVRPRTQEPNAQEQRRDR
jgi:epsilon-lactone hydrolase